MNVIRTSTFMLLPPTVAGAAAQEFAVCRADDKQVEAPTTEFDQSDTACLVAEITRYFE